MAKAPSKRGSKAGDWPEVRTSKLSGGLVMYWATRATALSELPGAPKIRDFEFRLPRQSPGTAPHVMATVFAGANSTGGAYNVSLIRVGEVNDSDKYATQVCVRAEAPPGGEQTWTFHCNILVIGKPVKALRSKR